MPKSVIWMPIREFRHQHPGFAHPNPDFGRPRLNLKFGHQLRGFGCPYLDFDFKSIFLDTTLLIFAITLLDS